MKMRRRRRRSTILKYKVKVAAGKVHRQIEGVGMIVGISKGVTRERTWGYR